MKLKNLNIPIIAACIYILISKLFYIYSSAPYIFSSSISISFSAKYLFYSEFTKIMILILFAFDILLRIFSKNHKHILGIFTIISILSIIYIVFNIVYIFNNINSHFYNIFISTFSNKIKLLNAIADIAFLVLISMLLYIRCKLLKINEKSFNILLIVLISLMITLYLLTQFIVVSQSNNINTMHILQEILCYICIYLIISFEAHNKIDDDKTKK